MFPRRHPRQSGSSRRAHPLRRAGPNRSLLRAAWTRWLGS